MKLRFLPDTGEIIRDEPDSDGDDFIIGRVSGGANYGQKPVFRNGSSSGTKTFAIETGKRIAECYNALDSRDPSALAALEAACESGVKDCIVCEGRGAFHMPVQTAEGFEAKLVDCDNCRPFRSALSAFRTPAESHPSPLERTNENGESR